MAYKSILTILTNPDTAELAITAAARLAQAQDAHLDVLVLGVDRTQVGYSYIGTGAVLMQVALDRAEADARALEAAAKVALAEQSPDLRYSVEAVVTQLGALTDVVASRARFADLVVLPRPYGPGQGAEAEAVVEAALFEGKAPVLVLPEKGLGENTLPKRIIVAWNQSSEAMVATRQALPLLKGADKVNITVIDPPTQGEERSDPGGMLCQMLVRHGVHAEVSVLARSLPRVSDVLARHIWDQNADMLVMGAYGHSRFREAILGGATRNMLEKAEVPVLMAH
ncbi:MAG: universal stress protein [Rhodobacterales bacterium RIFCSPHIGHO2_02_FULL_62_130]|jgi:nucleotide-binding universal stress UspA family protein|nr:MAG: universal stress protein [Rhodobacterales bacterium RIFCSPHIGHO2_02_FULL_62_130]OHC60883.1 MAG: universal stress protein [Rhodobacterales bacterium RIFCSPHIGHO2_12_FULL_62_75]HCY99293.1 universal stress protein [Rhodobacter sp.]